MIELGMVTEAWVENDRVIALAELAFDTHEGLYRLDCTPPPSSIRVDLELVARLLPGTKVRLDNPTLRLDGAEHVPSYATR